jgi:hypothetical protein
MAPLNEPRHVACGLVSPNPIMKAAMSAALAVPGNPRGPRLGRRYPTWSPDIR